MNCKIVSVNRNQLDLTIKGIKVKDKEGELAPKILPSSAEHAHVPAIGHLLLFEISVFFNTQSAPADLFKGYSD